MLNGGCDSYNVLIPHSGCVNASGGAHDLFADYEAVRGPVIALPKSTLNTIDASGSSQVCSTFGVHPVYQTAHTLYSQEKPEAAFIANVGPLVQPISKHQFDRRKRDSTVRLPPGLFAHNVQQKVIQAVHAQETQRAKGVLGRMIKELDQISPSGQPKFSVASYSTSGGARVLTGGPTRPYTLPSNGKILEYQRRQALRAEVANLTATESGSIFAETYAELLETSIADTVTLRAALEQPLGEEFPNGGISPQMKQARAFLALLPCSPSLLSFSPSRFLTFSAHLRSQRSSRPKGTGCSPATAKHSTSPSAPSTRTTIRCPTRNCSRSRTAW